MGALAAVASREDVSTVDHGDVATGSVAGTPIVQWLGETTDAIDGFVQSVVLNTPAELTADALDEILAAVVGRHDMLRARLVRGDALELRHPGGGPGRRRRVAGERPAARRVRRRSPPPGWTRTTA